VAGTKQQNAYAILGLIKGATPEEIKQAYVMQVKKYDPERHTDRFMVVQTAFDTLRDPARRAREDANTFNFIRGEFIYNNDERADAPDSQIGQALQAIEKKRADGSMNPHDADLKTIQVLMIRSWKKVQKKLWAEAIQDWQRVLEIDANHSRAKNNLLYSQITLGYSYATHELYDEAIEVWSRAVQMNPDNVALLHNLALANEHAGKWDESARFWKETVARWQAQLKREPDNDYLKNCIIEALRSHGERGPDRSGAGDKPLAVGGGGDQPSAKGEATPGAPARGSKSIGDYQEIIKLNPEDFDARYQVANMLMQEQKWDEAIEELTTMRGKWPRNVEVLNLLGWALLNGGKVDEAFMMWRKGRAIEPKNYQITESLIRAHMTMGRTMREKGLFTPCLVHFKALMNYLPESDEVHYEIAETYRKKGDERSAFQEYQKALKINPKHKGARNGLSTLKLRR
jgi:tetratricopeptide (TPR) repeat protein